MPNDQLDNLPTEVYDLVVVGGGINGVGIAVDAAGRGLSVLLCEQDDFASHTSSASSKLVHGGLRDLEKREFRLVRESLAEREILLNKAPHIVKPIRFVLPHQPHLRSAWMLSLGLLIYDYLGGRKHLLGSRRVRLGADNPLNSEIKSGYEYSDCWVDDSRLVVLNAIAAREKGAHLYTRTRCVSAKRHNGLWHVYLKREDGSLRSTHARALVNATGPWAARFIREELKQQPACGVRLIQGSHIVVPRLYEGEQAYMLQNKDHRVVVVSPYLGKFTLIGTTDHEYQGDLSQVAVLDEEIATLIKVSNEHFKSQLSRKDVLHCFSGVRLLCDEKAADISAITRDYTLSLSSASGEAPLLSVFGGKLTTYRKLAEAAMQQLAPYFDFLGPSWTENAPLPGGEDMESCDSLIKTLCGKYRWLPLSLAKRWAGSYGTRIWRLLYGVNHPADLGEHFGAGLYAREVDYLRHEEWACNSADILWRRSKLGFFMTQEQQAHLHDYLQSRALQPVLCT